MARVKNCVEKAEQVKINEYYDMAFSNVCEIFDACGNDEARMISLAFRFGYLQGQKALRAEEERG